MANWDKLSSRGSVEDRRTSQKMLALGGGGLSLTGIVLLFIFNYLSGGNLTDVVTQIAPQALTVGQEDGSQFQGADEYEVFASTIVGSSNDVWSGVLSQNGLSYSEPTLVLFRGATESACGTATSEIGPHYCPLDETIYLDERFFDLLQAHFGAGSADVSQAYVIAHEVGHHVQNELGYLETATREAEAAPEEANAISVQQELQADCFAGIWAHSLKDRGVFSPGEIQEAINAAGAVGDDRIQQKTTGRINPETWTHGSSGERIAAFERGYDSGDMEICSTSNR